MVQDKNSERTAATIISGIMIIAAGMYLWVTSITTFGGGIAVISPAACIQRTGNSFLLHGCKIYGAYILAGLYFFILWLVFIIIIIMEARR